MTEEVEQAVKNRLLVLFYQLGLEDAEILRVLHKEGHPSISKKVLARLRFSMGLKGRIRGTIAQEEAVIAARVAIEEQLKEGIIDGYGKRMIQLHLSREECSSLEIGSPNSMRISTLRR